MDKITESNYNSLCKELAQINERISETAVRLKDAVAEGDLSENAEYAKAKDDLASLKPKRAELEAMLHNVEIIQPSTGSEIEVGSYIKVKELDTDEPEQIFVLDSVSRYFAGFISVKSPIGKRVLGGTTGTYTINKAGKKRKIYVEKLQPTEEVENKFLKNSKTIKELIEAGVDDEV